MRVALSHFSVIVRGSAQLFVAGPPVVAAAMGESPDKEELGGARAQTRAGAVDNEAADEDDALDQLRRFLSYLPGSAWEAPPIAASTDDPRAPRGGAAGDRPARRAPAVRHAPRAGARARPRLGVRGRAALRPLADHRARRASTGGRSACSRRDPKHYGGGLTAEASDKLARFADLCDAFRLPVVNFVDQPGFVIGTDAERRGTIRRGGRALSAVIQARTPWCSVLVRKVYGVAGAGHGDGSRLNLRFAWPSGAWGSLPIAGGLEAAYRRELEAAEDPVALRAEIEERLTRVLSPFRTAERFSVEEIIDPRDTRPMLVRLGARARTSSSRSTRTTGPVARGTRV